MHHLRIYKRTKGITVERNMQCNLFNVYMYLGQYEVLSLNEVFNEDMPNSLNLFILANLVSYENNFYLHILFVLLKKHSKPCAASTRVKKEKKYENN